MIKKILFLFFLLPSLAFAHEEVFSVQGADEDKFGEYVIASQNPSVDPVSFVLISAPDADVAPFGSRAGKVIAYLGSNGNEVATLSSNATNDIFGDTLKNIGDLDGDGFEEVGINFLEDSGADINVGQFNVHTFKDLALLASEEGELPFARFGLSFTGISDINGNGGRDYVVFDGDGINDLGRIAFYDGKTHLAIRYRNGSQAGGSYGRLLENIGDLNSDGVEDLIVAADSETKIDPASGDPDPDFLYSGRVHILSGKDGALIDVIDGTEAGLQLGQFFRVLGDITGDGVSDIVLRGSRFIRSRYLYLYSGSTRERILEMNGLESDFDFGEHVARLGDLTGDGINEFAVSAHAANSAGGLERVDIYRGGTFSLLNRIVLNEGESIAALNSLYFNDDDELDLVITKRDSDGETRTVTIYDLDIPVPQQFAVATKVQRKGKFTVDLSLTDNFETCDIEMNLAASRKKLDAGKKKNIYSSDNLALLDSLSFRAKKLPSLSGNRKTLSLEVVLTCNDTVAARQVVKVSFKKNRRNPLVRKGRLIRTVQRKLALVP